MVFPVVMYGCESWTIKKAKCRITDAFELWCWRRLLRVPWTARRSNRSILKEISPGYSLEDWGWSWNSNPLATWWEELTHWKRPWYWERLKAEGEGDDRGWDGWMASLILWTWVWVSSSSWWWTEKPGMLQSMGLQGVGHDWVSELNLTHISSCSHGLSVNCPLSLKLDVWVVHCFFKSNDFGGFGATLIPDTEASQLNLVCSVGLPPLACTKTCPSPELLTLSQGFVICSLMRNSDLESWSAESFLSRR